MWQAKTHHYYTNFFHLREGTKLVCPSLPMLRKQDPGNPFTPQLDLLYHQSVQNTFA
jgi:hypothetical protein